MRMLSASFSLEEFVHSQVAARVGIANTPSPEVLANLALLAAKLEWVRMMLGSYPVTISSGYRSPALNKRIGGAKNSAHTQGLAVDFICPQFGSPREICKMLRDAVWFDQLICEGAWVHLAISAKGLKPRCEVLTAVFAKGQPTRYLPGLV